MRDTTRDVALPSSCSASQLPVFVLLCIVNQNFYSSSHRKRITNVGKRSKLFMEIKTNSNTHRAYCVPNT